MRKIVYFFIIICYIACLTNLHGQIKFNLYQDKGFEPNDQFVHYKNKYKENPNISENKASGFDAKDITWKWDTIVSYDTLNELYKRFTRTFDGNGNEIVKIIENRQDNTWINAEKYTSSYDASGNKLTYLYQKWQNNAWVNYERYTDTYNAGGKLLVDLYEQWIANNWVNSSRETNTYDPNGNRLNFLQEIWQNNTWENSFRGAYTYDNNGNEITFLHDFWLSNTWNNSCKFTSTYDANGNLLTYLFEMWKNNAWENSQLEQYTYDANNNKLTELSQTWDYAWLDLLKRINTFDINGNKLTSTTEFWDNNNWVNLEKDSSAFDENGNKVSEFIENWQNGWVYSRRNSNIYDVNGNSVNGQYDKMVVCCWTPEVGWLPLYSKNNYKVFQTDRLQAFRYEASYKTFNTGISDVNATGSFTVFPNPSTGNITIKNNSGFPSKESSISICNMQGQVLFQQMLFSETQNIDISILARGVYFLKLNDKDRMEVIKLVKN